MKLITFIIVALFVVLVGCTRDPASQVVTVPTLAVLPTEVAATVPPSQTIEPPSPLPPTVTPTFTLTPLPTQTQPPTSTNTPPATIAPSENPNSWIITTIVSPLDDVVTMGIGLDAESPVQGWLDEITPTLFVRCRAGVMDVFINIDTTFDSKTELDDKAYVALRWDKEKSQVVPMDELSKRDGVFFADPIGTLRLMFSHQVLIFGFEPFNANETAATFQLAGIRDAVQPLLTACNISGFDGDTASCWIVACCQF
jgi:hypothetical protein